MLQDDILQLREDIKAGHFTNEASVSKGIVLRLLSALSWPIFDPKVVISEYPLSGRRVDYALCHPPGKPALFIEVKTMGQSGSGERQLFEYAFHKGVPMAILTDGPEWHFYLPAEQGDYEERRVYKLDLVEREIGEIVRRLERYLKYDAVCSGEAVAAARRDYKDVARERLTKDTLPQAWAKLIEEEDELLLELVADRVESLCGYKPDSDTVAYFLKTHVPCVALPCLSPPLHLRHPSPHPRRNHGHLHLHLRRASVLAWMASGVRPGTPGKCCTRFFGNSPRGTPLFWSDLPLCPGMAPNADT